jgi:hypothetical protein
MPEYESREMMIESIRSKMNRLIQDEAQGLQPLYHPEDFSNQENDPVREEAIDKKRDEAVREGRPVEVISYITGAEEDLLTSARLMLKTYQNSIAKLGSEPIEGERAHPIDYNAQHVTRQTISRQREIDRLEQMTKEYLKIIEELEQIDYHPPTRNIR